MAFTATPEAPVLISGAQRDRMVASGYVSSINGKQGAVVLDVSGGQPPAGTPDNYIPVAIDGATEWVDPSTLVTSAKIPSPVAMALLFGGS